MSDDYLRLTSGGLWVVLGANGVVYAADTVEQVEMSRAGLPRGHPDRWRLFLAARIIALADEWDRD